MADPYLYQRHMEREEDRLTEACNNGEITNAEYHAEMRELRLDYEAAAVAAAEDEYEQWF